MPSSPTNSSHPKTHPIHGLSNPRYLYSPCIYAQLSNRLTLQCSSGPAPQHPTCGHPLLQHLKPQSPTSQYSNDPATLRQVSTITQTMIPILRAWDNTPLYNSCFPSANIQHLITHSGQHQSTQYPSHLCLLEAWCLNTPTPNTINTSPSHHTTGNMHPNKLLPYTNPAMHGHSNI